MDISYSERSVAVQIGQRLRTLLRADQHAKLNNLMAPFALGAADEGNTRGNFFELRLLNALSDADIASIELEFRPPGVSTNNTVDWFCPNRHLAVEAQSNRSIQVPAFQFSSHPVTDEQMQAVVHNHIYSTLDVVEDQAQSLLGLVNDKCARKHFEQLTASVWLITEIFDGDYFQNLTCTTEREHRMRLCEYFLRDAVNAPKIPIRGLPDAEWPENVVVGCPYVRFAFSVYVEEEHVTHLYVIPRTDAERHETADLQAALNVSVEVLAAT